MIAPLLTVWGSEIRFERVTCVLPQQRRRSGGDVLLVGEPAEDSFAVDSVLDEVDRFGWSGVGLGRCELAEGTVRPGAVVVPQALGQQLSQVMLINDQQPVDELTAQATDDPSQIAFALGACGGLAKILMPSAWNTASKGIGELARAVPDQELD